MQTRKSALATAFCCLTLALITFSAPASAQTPLASAPPVAAQVAATNAPVQSDAPARAATAAQTVSATSPAPTAPTTPPGEPSAAAPDSTTAAPPATTSDPIPANASTPAPGTPPAAPPASESNATSATSETPGDPAIVTPTILAAPNAAVAADVCAGKTTVRADVVAIAQPLMLNRLGANVPTGLIFALKSDAPGGQLRKGKRPRPIVLRVNQGDCLQINFTNQIPAASPALPKTPEVSIHVQGMQWVKGAADDGSFVGVNQSSLANVGTSKTYTLYAEREGTYLLHTTGDLSSIGKQLESGLFGAVNVQPAGAEWYRSQVTAADLKLATSGATPDGHPTINYNAVYPANFADVSRRCTPVLRMAMAPQVVSGNNCVPAPVPAPAPVGPVVQLYHTDLTAVITGPKAGRFPGSNGVNNVEPDCDKIAAGAAGDPLFCRNPALPDRKQPYREVTIIYHEVNGNAVQAFPIFTDPTMKQTMVAGIDGFAINYGTGGIGSEIFANRVGVGPMGDCVDCRYEEFFLSSWAVGDPAMLVDKPANTPLPAPPGSSTNCFDSNSFNAPPCGGTRVPLNPPVTGVYEMQPLKKATVAFFADDPSNVYHSYLSDHVKYRILHGGIGVSHVHHQHAHQWLQSPNSDKSQYLDSQMISPGASYTLEMVYHGSGNRNKTVGDSIFHCHFYPHFAAGMWSMWRVHDVFEAGTALDAAGRPAAGARALPDGEINAGTPIPALVPMPTLPMAPMPSSVFIQNGQVVYGTPGTPDPTGASVTKNPGYPFFIPGMAGSRPPHPPFDFAPDGGGGELDGGLPRHLVTGGTIKNEQHTTRDWSKDLYSLEATQLPEKGTKVENVAIDFNRVRLQPTFLPDGTPGQFRTNGLPNGPQLGAPYADPGVTYTPDDGTETGAPVPVPGPPRRYKAAAIQLNVKLNKQGWHFPQQRILTLWQDVMPTYNFSESANTGRRPEPLFIRADSDDVVEFWHTNLVPDYYLVDDFQVRTPTDIIGQHIHLVKFDVTSSDGAANGWNYEDGTFSPEEVQHAIASIKKGTWQPVPGGPTQAALAPKKPPSDIINCPSSGNADKCAEWMGAQTTVQRWYADTLRDDEGRDRTMRTVFTHDHFGPSTHQQAGLYAAVAIEPRGSVWKNSETGKTMGGSNIPPVRPDGGPTSWKADIIVTNPADNSLTESYREFLLEFQDFQLAYYQGSKAKPNPGHSSGWMDPANAISAPPTPQLVSTGFGGATPGTQSVNYYNAPIPFRVDTGGTGDFSDSFDSTFQIAPEGGTPSPANGDPETPLMRAYEGDKVQVRVLVGAHMFSHFFNIQRLTWLAEPNWTNAGYRSSQAMGLSEHFEMLFDVPPSSAPTQGRKCPDKTSDGNCADYFYSPSLDDTGLANGMWGIFRAYDTTKKAEDLQPLPNNPVGGATSAYTTCPAGANVRNYNVTAVTAQKALPSPDPTDPTKGKLVFNSRGLGTGTGTPGSILRNRFGLLYVFTKDLDANGKLKAGVPVEPLILRAAAGDCINVTLTNAIDPNSDIYTSPDGLFTLPAPFNSSLYDSRASQRVGMHPQLLAYDVVENNGMVVGYNKRKDGKSQLVYQNESITYTWYAGNISRSPGGAIQHTPIEFGGLNLTPGDPLLQHVNGLFGAVVIEPAGATWQCGVEGQLGSCSPDDAVASPVPKTRASATVKYTQNNAAQQFREFVVMTSDDLKFSNLAAPGAIYTSGINYSSEPTYYRFGKNQTTPPQAFANNGDNSCALINGLVNGDPQTPIFTANVGSPVRFRLLHTQGTGNVQVFTVHGHVWQRNPYVSTAPNANTGPATPASSNVIGNNVLSQWMGSHDNYGSSDHFELVIDKAGGANGKAGDYLYTVFLPGQAKLGAWGIFRVGAPFAATPPFPACTTSPFAPAPVAPAATPEPGSANDTERMRRQPIVNQQKRP